MKKIYDRRTFSKVLYANGYYLARTAGSHFIYTNGRRTISVNKDLNRMVAKRLIKEHDLVA